MVKTARAGKPVASTVASETELGARHARENARSLQAERKIQKNAE